MREPTANAEGVDLAQVPMEPMLLKDIIGLFPEGGAEDIRVHPDDIPRLWTALRTAYWVLIGPTVLVSQLDAVNTTIEIKAGIGMQKVPPGLWRMVPVTPDYEEMEMPVSDITDELMIEREQLRNEVWERVTSFWNFDGPVPFPNDRFVCGCGNEEWIARHWHFSDYGLAHDPAKHKFRYRCDVSLKCSRCGNVNTWGVVVHDDYWEKWGHSPRKVFPSQIEDMKEAANERLD